MNQFVFSKKIFGVFVFSLLGFALNSGLWASDVIMKMTSDDGSTNVEFQNASATQVGSIDSTGKLEISSHVKTGGYLSIPELTSPGSPSVDRVRLFAKDVGGETYLAYIDSTGRERIIRALRDYVVADSELVATNLGVNYKDVHYSVAGSSLSRVVINFDGYTEARIVFAVDNNEADTIQCRIYNETTATEITSATSNGTGAAELVVGSWTAINLEGDDVILALCREGTGATADPDIGPVHLQVR
jgi:hypothetical protein